MHNLLETFKAFQPVANAVIEKRSQIPELTHIIVKEGLLIATDLRLTVAMSAPLLICDLQLADEQIYGIPLKILTEALKTKPDNLTVKVGGKDITLSYGKGKRCFPRTDPDAYIALPKMGRTRRIGKWNREYVELLKTMVPFLGDDELKIALMEVFMSQGSGITEICATNGHILRLVENIRAVPKNAHFKGLIPLKMIKFLDKFLKDAAEVSVSKTHLRISLGNLTIYWRLTDERYPDYRSVLPADMIGMVSLDPTDVLEVLNSAKPFVNTITKNISLYLDKNNPTAKIVANDVEAGKEWVSEIPFAYHSGPGIVIGFNLDYLISVISGLNGTITWRYRSNTGANIFRSNNEPDALHLLMPIRING